HKTFPVAVSMHSNHQLCARQHPSSRLNSRLLPETNLELMRVHAFRTTARSALRVLTTGALVQLAMLCTLANTAAAAVRPMPVGPGGVGPITFDTLPAL